MVQEALTNALKHAGAAKVIVTVTHDGSGLTLEVVEDNQPGVPQPSVGAGRGLTGMAERVQALGGALSAQRLTPRGLRVLARLPVAP